MSDKYNSKNIMNTKGLKIPEFVNKIKKKMNEITLPL